jgi:hypothetical protein
MTTLTVDQSAQTPSAHAVAKAATTFVVVDAAGRKITLKKPDVLVQYDLIEALEETAKNEVYIAMVLPLLYITQIDGEHELPLTNKLRIRAMIQRLGEDGINTVMRGVQEHFGGASVDGDKAAIKK